MSQSALLDGETTVSGEIRKATPNRYADIAVHMTGSDIDAAAIGVAQTLATLFDAHVETLLTNYIPAPPAVAAPGVEMLAAELRSKGRQAGEALQRAAKETLERRGAECDIRRIDGTGVDFAHAAARLARSSDLFVLSQPMEGDPNVTSVLEGILFEAGSAALVVPKEAVPTDEYKTILVAWRDTPECARAIAAALPLLQRAETVVLTSVAENGSDEERHREPAAETARHLARHGVNVEIRHVSKWKHPAQGLINEAEIIGASLIVLGAYGHSRLREMILGGVTRELLQTSRIPLLMVH